MDLLVGSCLDILRTRRIELTLDGDRICADFGSDLVTASTASASRFPRRFARSGELANRIEAEKEVSVWVPYKAQPYVEDGKLKRDCSELWPFPRNTGTARGNR